MALLGSWLLNGVLIARQGNVNFGATQVAFTSPVPSRLRFCAKGLSGSMVRDRGLSACPDVSTESDSSGSIFIRESALKGIGGVPDLHVRTG